MKKFKKSLLSGSWIKDPNDETIEYLIRPISIISMTTQPSALEKEIKFNDTIEWFIFALKDWKGVVDDDDKPLPCDDENKRMFFDFNPDGATFIVNKGFELRAGVIPKDELKN
jgi:hypothetical protein